MKEKLRIYADGFRTHPRETLIGLIRLKAVACVLSGFLGFLMSRAVIFQSLAPFGLSAVGALKKKEMYLSCGVGAALGYLIVPGLDSVRYMAAVLVLCGVKLLLDLFVRRELKLSGELLVLCVCLFTGTGAMIPTIEGAKLILLGAETVVCVACTYLFREAKLPELEVGQPLTGKQLVSLCILCGVLLLSLSSVYLSFLSLGRILCTAVVLAAGYRKGVKGGSIAGIACGVAASLAGRDLSYVAVAMSVAGLCAGALARLPWLMPAVYLAIFWLIGSYFSGVSVVFGMAEAVLGMLVFLGYLTVAKRRGVALHGEPTAVPAGGAPRDQHDLLELSRGIGEFARLLTKQLNCGCEKTDITQVFQQSAQQCCRRCGLNVYCWGQEYDQTMEGIRQAAEILVRRGELKAEDLKDNRFEKCVRSSELIGAVNSQYKRFQSGLTESELKDRQAAVDQYKVFASFLEELSSTKGEREYDCTMSNKLLRMLEEEGLQPRAASVYRYPDGGREADLLFPSLTDVSASADQLAELVAELMGRACMTPEASLRPDGVQLVIREQGSFYLEHHHLCVPKRGERQCGDTVRFFTRRDGGETAVLCDGMGSGSGARSDSLFAVRSLECLLKSGVSFECALRFIGANLNYSDRESFTTVDLFEFSREDGQALFVKSGAAPSFVLGKTGLHKISAGSLPIGILSGQQPDVQRVKLEAGDLVVLVSDGAVGADGDTGLLEDFLVNAYQGVETDVEKLAARITQLCCESEDDVTAVVIKICAREKGVRRASKAV